MSRPTSGAAAASRERPRVLHLLESDGVYGAENVVLNLSREMAVDGSFEPVIGCLVKSQEDRKDLLLLAAEYGVAALPVLFRNRVFPYDLLATPGRLKRQCIRLVHAHNRKASILAFVAGAIAGIPLIATCHLLFEGKTTKLTSRLLNAIELLLFRTFPKIVCVSRAIKDGLTASGIPSRKVQVINNGIYVGNHTTLGRDVIRSRREILGLRPGSPVILNLARLTEQKAQADLLLATRALIDAGHDPQLLLVGDGELRSQLEQEIQRLGLDNHVHLLGFRSDAGELLKIADVFALPSLDEGLPMSLLEAMAAGVPILASGVGAIPEVVRDRRDGLLVPPGDVPRLTHCLLELLKDPAFASGLAANARSRVESLFSSKAMYEQYKVIYNEIFQLQDRPSL